MTLTNVIFLILAIVGLLTVAVLWANGVEDEPPATAAERRFWPGDVVEDDGSCDG